MQLFLVKNALLLQCIAIGTISSIELNHKPLDMAKKGQEVCIKIENTTGDAPKMYGRHFDYEDLLVSKVRKKEKLKILYFYFNFYILLFYLYFLFLFCFYFFYFIFNCFSNFYFIFLKFII